MPLLTQRVRERIKAYVDAQGHGAQRALLRHINRDRDVSDQRSDSWLSDILHKRADIMADDIDAVAAAMNVPPGDLVRGYDRNYWELTIEESDFVTWLRGLTSDGRRHFLSWVTATAAQRRLQVGAHQASSATNEPSVGGSHAGVSATRVDKIIREIITFHADATALFARLTEIRDTATTVSLGEAPPARPHKAHRPFHRRKPRG